MNWFSINMKIQRPLRFRFKNSFRVQLRSCLNAMLILVCCAGSSLTTPDLKAGEADEKNPQVSQLVVRDVNVFLVSAHGKKLNDATLFRSTTPGYMLSRRLNADSSESDKPVPLGLMTFEGPEVKDIDILIEFPAGRFLSHWPTARIQSKRIYWRSQNLFKDSPLSMRLTDQHWLRHLQNADRLFVKGIDKTERFILYDVELNHAPGITLSHSKEGFQVQNREAFPLNHVTILQPTAEKQAWKMASIEQIPGVQKSQKKTDSKPASKPGVTATSKKADPLSDKSLTNQAKTKKANQLAALGNQLRAIDALPTAASPAVKTSKKAAAPSSQKVPSVSVPYSSDSPLTRETALNVWEKKLADLGLGKPEITHVLGILSQYAFREDQATVVYCMDEAYLDKILPIEITPFPEVFQRTAIVILVDADPALLQRIKTLIAQLGDPKWEQREAAQKKLEEYGKAAQAELQKATKNKDLEIVFRSEQILGTIK